MLMPIVCVMLALLVGPSRAPVSESYLPPAEAQRLTDLLPPPVEALTEAEAHLIEAVQREATPEARARAVRAEPGDPLWDFAESMGPAFSKENCKAVETLIARAQQAGDPINAAAKKKFNRARPAISGLKSSDAYPSGHCVRAFLRARLLSELAPGAKETIYRQASTMALNRVIVGKHHPSDCAAGMALGEAIAEAILAEAAARPEGEAGRDLSAARAEWARVGSPGK